MKLDNNICTILQYCLWIKSTLISLKSLCGVINDVFVFNIYYQRTPQISWPGSVTSELPERKWYWVGVGLFCYVSNERMRGNGLKLCQGTFRSDIRKKITERVLGGIGILCPGRWWNPCLWNCSRGPWMWHLGTWIRVDAGGAGWPCRCLRALMILWFIHSKVIYRGLHSQNGVASVSLAF